MKRLGALTSDQAWAEIKPWWDMVQDMAETGFFAEVDAKVSRATDGYINIRDPRTSPWWAYAQLHKAAYSLVMALVQEREITAANAKAFEKASQVLLVSDYKPRKNIVWSNWYEKVKAAIGVVQRVLTAPSKTADNKFLVGPFEVVNSVGKSSADLAPLVKLLDVVVQKVKQLPVSGLERVLYGRVMLTGQIKKNARLAAWYDIAEDQLWVRVGKYDLDFLHTVIHELGHRWWRKFASKSVKSAWEQHHLVMGFGSVEIPRLHVGDPLPIQVKGVKGNPVIVAETGKYWEIDAKDSKGRPILLDRMSVYDAMHNNAKRRLFPTLYSSTDAEEHFCEALGLWALGDLKEPHLSAIKSAVSK